VTSSSSRPDAGHVTLNATHPGRSGCSLWTAVQFPGHEVSLARSEHADGMTDRDDFLAWVKTTLYDAELALHNGDAAPRRALWSSTEPVSVLGAFRDADGQQELDQLFTALGASFSHCTSYAFELQAYDVVGDMAYTAGREHTSACVDGQPRSLLRGEVEPGHREILTSRSAHSPARLMSGGGEGRSVVTSLDGAPERR
jgi:hypothetical protein